MLFVDLDIAKRAKALGFAKSVRNFWKVNKKPFITTGLSYMSERDEVTNWNSGNGSYPTSPEKVICSAPTVFDLIEWLAEKNIFVTILPYQSPDVELSFYYSCVDLVDFSNNDEIQCEESHLGAGEENYRTRLEAYQAGIVAGITCLDKETKHVQRCSPSENKKADLRNALGNHWSLVDYATLTDLTDPLNVEYLQGVARSAQKSQPRILNLIKQL